jgi:hypothetical protein
MPWPLDLVLANLDLLLVLVKTLLTEALRPFVVFAIAIPPRRRIETPNSSFEGKYTSG